MTEFNSEYARDKSGQGRLLKAKFSVCMLSLLNVLLLFFHSILLMLNFLFSEIDLQHRYGCFAGPTR